MCLGHRLRCIKSLLTLLFVAALNQLLRGSSFEEIKEERKKERKRFVGLIKREQINYYLI